MQLPTWLSRIVKSGEATLSTGDVEVLQIKAEDNEIELSIKDKEFFKDVLGSIGGGASVWSKLGQLKIIASELKDEGLTVTIFYKDDCLVTIGLEAKPKFSRLVTRTDAVEINNLRKVIELSV
ncbi:MAG TPA: hypothetical protein ENN36_03805 [Candidatus Bathyarchaeota archaeon]|nr:hypothetical protein [Candidatus Bathyarchaeota archaeon]